MSIETTADQVYDALYQNVGDGLRGPDGSIVEMWRSARAAGIAAVTVDARAALQAFPDKSTDFLSVYESLLAYPLDPSLTTEQKQSEIATRYIQSIDAAYGSIETQIHNVDPMFEVLEPGIAGYAFSSTTENGTRPFEDWDPDSPLACGPAYGLAGRTHTMFPNYSSDFIVPVQLQTGGTGITNGERRLISLVKEQLNDMLPAWVDFRVFKFIGFELDHDPLDITVFGDGV